ncbi:MAG TPA: hypothetical protein ENK57_17740 [Polyangiaceae bacterium]|nr:hypothetical protein [Polyangiaceae bacterium]
MVRLAATLCFCLVLGGLASGARAQQVELQQARDAYAAGDYEQVRALLYPLVGGLVPAVRDPFLIRDARRFLGAAYVLLGRTQDAELQFGWLLRDQSLEQLRQASLEPTLFFARVREIFDRLRDARIAELEQRAAAEQRQAAAREARRHAAILQLVQFAQEVEVEAAVDPLPTYVPFGVGQFSNGDEGLGWFFATSEGGLLLVSTAASLAFSPLYDDVTSPQVLVDTMFGLAVGAGAAFALFALIGIIEARVRFVPLRRRTIEREIPPEVLQELELAAGPGGVVLRGRFF